MPPCTAVQEKLAGAPVLLLRQAGGQAGAPATTWISRIAAFKSEGNPLLSQYL